MKAFSPYRVRNFSRSASTQQETHAPFFGVQTKLSIGKANDGYEKEADAMADKVVAKTQKQDTFFGSSTSLAAPSIGRIQRSPFETKETSETSEEIQEKPLAQSVTPVVQLQSDEDEIQKKCAACSDKDELPASEAFKMPSSLGTADVQHKCDECDSEETLQKSSLQNTAETALHDGTLQTRLQQSKGNGSPMDAGTQQQMETGFGADFSHVRIHTGTSAVQMSQELGAHAFTNGSDIYFNRSQYDPNSTSGKHLLAHELTHTLQQGTGRPMVQRQLQLPRHQRTATRGADSCANFESNIQSAIAQASQWVQAARSWFTTFRNLVRARARNAGRGPRVVLGNALYQRLQLLEQHFRVSRLLGANLWPTHAQQRYSAQQFTQMIARLRRIESKFTGMNVGGERYNCVNNFCPTSGMIPT
ncbi:MAG: DUF4157 domain-containing protein, partial [Bacteroidota bacterium]